jgi:hypothetical protein
LSLPPEADLSRTVRTQASSMVFSLPVTLTPKDARFGDRDWEADSRAHEVDDNRGSGGWENRDRSGAVLGGWGWIPVGDTVGKQGVGMEIRMEGKGTTIWGEDGGTGARKDRRGDGVGAQGTRWLAASPSAPRKR